MNEFDSIAQAREIRVQALRMVTRAEASHIKNGEPVFHDAVPTVTPGKWLSVAPADGAQAGKTLLSTGAPLAYAMQWIRRDGLYRGYAVHSLPLWSMGSAATGRPGFSLG